MASVLEKAASVYDILYADVARLSSLLAQFSEDGLETEIVRAAEEAATSKAGLSIKVIAAEASESGRESTTRKIDPQWLIPLAFLDRAQDIIQRDIESATIGSIVLSQGSMTVTDLGLLQKLWSVPALKAIVLKQMSGSADSSVESTNRAQRRNERRQKVDTSEAELMLELLPVLPHSPQVNIVTDRFAVWTTIDPKWLVGTVEDLVLKHGSKIAGGWTMVGILDARPMEERADGEYDELLTPIERIHLGMYGENVWSIAMNLALPVRQALGRPLLSYGVTPLIIFRAIET